MRTLFLSPCVPFPLNTGRHLRIYHLLRAVARAGEVTLVCLAQEGEHDVDGLRAICQQVYVIPREKWGCAADLRLPRPVMLAKSLWQHLHPTEPASLQWYRSEEAEGLVHRLYETGFDLIWADSLAVLRLVPLVAGDRVVVSLQDVEHARLWHKLRRARRVRSFILDLLEFAKWRRIERRLCGLPYRFAVCSEQDRRALGGGPKIVVVPNGVTVPPSDRLREPSSALQFLFVGSLSYHANVDATVFFTRRILPLIRRQLPDARFQVVGTSPPPEVSALDDGRTVKVVGSVPTVAPYLQEALALVVPLRFGGGTRIKILEAMAHGRPVVSTTVGAEGIEVEAGRHLLIADSPAEFAQACLRLARDPELGKRLAAEGRRLVKERYQWEAIEEKVCQLSVDVVRGACEAISASGPELTALAEM